MYVVVVCRMLKILIMTYPSVLLSSRLYGSVSVQTKPLKSRIHSFVRVPPSRCLDTLQSVLFPHWKDLSVRFEALISTTKLIFKKLPLPS